MQPLYVIFSTLFLFSFLVHICVCIDLPFLNGPGMPVSSYSIDLKPDETATFHFDLNKNASSVYSINGVISGDTIRVIPVDVPLAVSLSYDTIVDDYKNQYLEDADHPQPPREDCSFTHVELSMCPPNYAGAVDKTGWASGDNLTEYDVLLKSYPQYNTTLLTPAQRQAFFNASYTTRDARINPGQAVVDSVWCNSMKFYFVEVTDAAANLVIEVTQSDSSCPDGMEEICGFGVLFVRYATCPTFQSYDYRQSFQREAIISLSATGSLYTGVYVIGVAAENFKAQYLSDSQERTITETYPVSDMSCCDRNLDFTLTVSYEGATYDLVWAALFPFAIYGLPMGMALVLAAAGMCDRRTRLPQFPHPGAPKRDSQITTTSTGSTSNLKVKPPVDRSKSIYGEDGHVDMRPPSTTFDGPVMVHTIGAGGTNTSSSSSSSSSSPSSPATPTGLKGSLSTPGATSSSDHKSLEVGRSTPVVISPSNPQPSMATTVAAAAAAAAAGAEKPTPTTPLASPDKNGSKGGKIMSGGVLLGPNGNPVIPARPGVTNNTNNTTATASSSSSSSSSSASSSTTSSPAASTAPPLRQPVNKPPVLARPNSGYSVAKASEKWLGGGSETMIHERDIETAGGTEVPPHYYKAQSAGHAKISIGDAKMISSLASKDLPFASVDFGSPINTAESLDHTVIAYQSLQQKLIAEGKLIEVGVDDSRTPITKFYWVTLLVLAVFAAVPAFQFVLAQQLADESDESICHFNFRCRRDWRIVDWLEVEAFNNWLSNTGFVLAGLFLIGYVSIRTKYRSARTKKRYASLTGKLMLDPLATDPDLFYACGVAIMMEGVFSAIYHLCPTLKFFQFDSLFMFFIAAMFFVSLYARRHGNYLIDAKNFFFLLCGVITANALGVAALSLGRDAIFWAFFHPIFVSITAGIAVKMYWYKKTDNEIIQDIWYHTRFGKELCKRFFRCKFKQNFLIDVLEDPTMDPEYWQPPLVRPYRFFAIFVGVTANWVIVTVAAVQRWISSDLLLFVMIGTWVSYLFYYIYMKLKRKVGDDGEPLPVEPIPIYTGVLFILGVIFTAVAIYFFSVYVTDKTEPLDWSRQLNRPCLFLSYDHHDMWHFFSAFALLFQALVLYHLDDGVGEKYAIF